MKIVFDARCIDVKASGASVYVRELLRRLPVLAPEWSWHVLFCNEETRRSVIADALPGNHPNVSTEILPYRFNNLLGKAKLVKTLLNAKCDLYFSPIVANSFLALGRLTGTRRTVVGVHSNPMRDTKSLFWRLIKRFCLMRATSSCDAVIAASSTLRDDIVRQLSLSAKSANRIKVVYAGVSKSFSPAPSPPPADKAKVILYVGNQRHYKNLDTLVRAFSSLRHRQGAHLHLLLIGPEGINSASIRELVRNLGVNDHVTFAGERRERELAAAYREASLFVCPSSYEGFSLPLLEAMACGTPVVCCDGGAQHELVGNVSDVVPAGDVQALCDAMTRMLTDDAFRAKSVQAGIERAAAFSWDRTAAETLAIFREAAANGKNANTKA
jgi:glycosyltransferase involved in cell wall biosynthesis